MLPPSLFADRSQALTNVCAGRARSHLPCSFFRGRFIMRWMGLAAVALFAATVVPATAQQENAGQREYGTILSVAAIGTSEARPDMATINLGVTTQGATAQEALADNAQRMSAVLRTLRSAGVAERDIQTSWVRVNPRYENRPSR